MPRVTPVALSTPAHRVVVMQTEQVPQPTELRVTAELLAMDQVIPVDIPGLVPEQHEGGNE